MPTLQRKALAMTKERKSMKKVLALLLLFAMCLSLCACDSLDYKKAKELFDAGEYQQAKELCEKIVPYKDAVTIQRDCEAKLIEAELNTILSQNLILECTGGSGYEMIIENTSERDLSNVRIYFTLYSEDGLLLDTVSDNFQKWAAGSKNKASIHTNEKFAAVKLHLECSSSADHAEAVSEMVDLEWVNNYHINIALLTDPSTEFDYKVGRKIRTKCIIDSFEYEDRSWSDGKAYVTLRVTGTKTFDYQGDDKTNSCQVAWKLYSQEGNVADTGSFYIKGCKTGEVFNVESSASGLEPGVYTLELSNYE